MKFDLDNPLTTLNGHKNDDVPALFATESDHMPAFKSSDVRFSIRHHAFSLVSQAQFSHNLDQFTTYLAVNYIDRFLSEQVVMENKPWIVRILAIASLSLAAKMRSINLSLSDIQRDGSLIFNAESIQRTELMILTTLKWRLRSVTPFAFLRYFNSLFELGDSSLSQSLKDRATDIIFCSHYEIKLFKYKPSVLAASALLCAAELIPRQFSFFFDAVSKCQHINAEELLNCWRVMSEILTYGNHEYYYTVDAVSTSTLTPKSVLDHECTISPEQRENPDRNNNSKRRRLKNFLDDQTFELPKVQEC